MFICESLVPVKFVVILYVHVIKVLSANHGEILCNVILYTNLELNYSVSTKII